MDASRPLPTNDLPLRDSIEDTIPDGALKKERA